MTNAKTDLAPSQRMSSFIDALRYNFGFQFLARLMSFGINIYLLRVVSMNVLGIANVRLTLLYTTILFCVREPFRRACLSNESCCTYTGEENSDHVLSSKSNRQRFVNTIWLCPLFAVALAGVLGLFYFPYRNRGFIWTHFLSIPAEHSDEYGMAVWSFALCAVIETIAEPLWLIAQTVQSVRMIAVTQAIHVLAQRVILAVVVMATGQHNSLMPFVVSMIASSLLYTIIFYVYMIMLIRREKPLNCQSIADLLPSLGGSIDGQRCLLVAGFVKHSIMKQILTDGASYVMTLFDVLSFDSQGVYDTIDKLGSLVARILLAPLEESTYVYFTKSLDRNKPANEQDKAGIETATAVLTGVLRCVSVLGLIVCTFGLAYSKVALNLYAGAAFTNHTAIQLLRVYAFYVLFLALNGISECFLFATINVQQVSRHQHFLTILAVFYIGTQIMFGYLMGPLGFVFANCLNMIVRIAYSFNHIHTYFKDQNTWPILEIIPNFSTLISLFFAFFFTNLSNMIFCCYGTFNTVTHLAIGVLALGAVLITVVQTDQKLTDFGHKFVTHKKTE